MSRRQATGASASPSRRSLLPLALGAFAVAGCAVHGPDAVRASRIGYNEAVQVSDQRELLLNLVRLRYTEAPEFLAVNGISAQMRFDAGASVGGAIGEDAGDDVAFLAPGLSIAYSESPTITFTPRRDQEFTRQLVAPVELDSLYLLSHYGWGLDRVLALVVDEVNGVSNRISREDESGGRTDLTAFRTLVTAARRFETAGLLSIDVHRRRDEVSAPMPAAQIHTDDVLAALAAGYRLERASSAEYVVTGERTHYVLRVDPRAWESTDFGAFMMQLGLPPGGRHYDIDAGRDPGSGRVGVSTRSVLGTMAYLSKAVSVPPDHAALVGSDPAPHDALEPLMQVRVSAQPVGHAYIAVEYRGHWFYIDDRDLESKRTFGLLTSLVRLSIGAGGAQNVPILTLPVAR